MHLTLVGPGRAGMSLALACRRAGHEITGVLARNPGAAQAAAVALDSRALHWEAAVPATDLVVLAVRDDAIASVAEHLAGKVTAAAGAVHLSGMVPVAVLSPLGIPIGSFHPLQSMPTPAAGAVRLSGAWVGITCDDNLLADRLFALAASLEAHPFEIADAQKPLYHAAAAAAANFTLAALAVSQRLFAAAGVDFAAAAPLIDAVVANAHALGPEGALTGPVSRGDAATVRAQVAAVAANAPELLDSFVAMVRATAVIAGTSDAIEAAL